ncbi:MAG: hypothetical protein EOO65_05550, partial [Methanosarcinales archaeon]
MDDDSPEGWRAPGADGVAAVGTGTPAQEAEAGAPAEWHEPRFDGGNNASGRGARASLGIDARWLGTDPETVSSRAKQQRKVSTVATTRALGATQGATAVRRQDGSVMLEWYDAVLRSGDVEGGAAVSGGREVRGYESVPPPPAFIRTALTAAPGAENAHVGFASHVAPHAQPIPSASVIARWMLPSGLSLANTLDIKEAADQPVLQATELHATNVRQLLESREPALC